MQTEKTSTQLMRASQPSLKLIEPVCDLEYSLRQHFKFDRFREGQREIIESVLNGRDVLAIMPTGSGKSLCYQLPSVLRPGITLVISPLIALMNDQTAQLKQRGIPAGSLHSGLDLAEQKEVFQEMRRATNYLLYLAPERVLKPTFIEWLKEAPVQLVVIDEAHCIPQWGKDFRPEYGQLSLFRKTRPKIPILALTATATQHTQKEIIKSLKLKRPDQHIHGFYRSNLRIEAKLCESEEERTLWLDDTLKDFKGGRAIIYCGTRQSTDDWADWLRSRGLKAQSYHAGLSTQVRAQREAQFRDNKFTILTATTAFGMGVDLADIRLVVHTCLPPNIENYYQEIGRAGRDGAASRCLLLMRKSDISLHHFFINRSPAKTRSQLWDNLRVIENFVENPICRHQQILNFFRDKTQVWPCGNCDNCENENG